MPTVQAPRNAVRQQVSSAVRAPQGQADTRALDIAKVVSTGLGVFADVKNRMNTTAAEEAAVGFERDKNALFFNPENGYFNTQGRNAFDGAEGVNASLADLRKQYAEGLESPDAKRMFNKVANAHITRAGTDIMRHASKGAQAWEVATIESQVENSVENASLYHNQPDKMRVQRALGRQAVLKAAQMQGITGEPLNERLQNYESTFATAAISSATAVSADDGQQMLDDMIKRVEGPDIVRLQKAIAAKKKTETLQINAQQSLSVATQLVRDYDTRNEILDEVNKIEDPVLQKKTRSEAMHQFSLRKQAESEEQASAFADAENHLAAGGSSDGYQATYPESWEKLSTKQKKSIESGKAVITDWNSFSDLMTLPKAQLAKVNPVDHFSKLAPAERNKLISAVKTANGTSSASQKIDHQVGRTRISETNSAVDQLYGKKIKRDDVEKEQANAFHALLDTEASHREQLKGAALTSEEYTAMLADFTRKSVEEGFFFDSEVDLTEVPPENVPALSKFLRANNVPVTADNLIKAFQQASE